MGSPITQRLSDLAGSRTIGWVAKAKKVENPFEPRSGHGTVRLEQLFHPLELEAGVARTLVELDPRHALVPNLYFQHGALLAHAPTAIEGASRFIRPPAVR
ncbi:MAG: hypothetical protein ACJ8AH_23400 [Stellaceae bacterium]